ncbi:DUF2255 family protein [Ulvibacter antarcticus]|uniref:Uncharacterized protein DUF2255 n=1 Tax=Ulvibacter antarcticus TaxID=442714 RepID=A0A3L9YYZ5_9FLAO|nr:DUF2255 family protein [Ulvibacter antarcticus]RMA65793.1 uncharacterized protein DUF2255 [Ulvibacter antarcticus]
MSFPNSFYSHLKVNNYTGIIGGRERETFLEIWVVAVNKRVFARSWDKSERSWFTAFLNSGIGKLQYGDEVIEVEGKKLKKTDSFHQKINEAYVKRYTEKENIYYAQGISQPEYADFTIEFFYKEN